MTADPTCLPYDWFKFNVIPVYATFLSPCIVCTSTTTCNYLHASIYTVFLWWSEPVSDILFLLQKWQPRKYLILVSMCAKLMINFVLVWRISVLCRAACVYNFLFIFQKSQTRMCHNFSTHFKLMINFFTCALFWCDT